MSPKPSPARIPIPPPAFDVQAFLRSAGLSPRTVRFATGAVVFAQGAQANAVFYLQEGGVKLSVLSSTGKEAVVAMLGPGDFFGEGCLAGQLLRMGSATAFTPTSVLVVTKAAMVRLLHKQRTMSDRFIAHMLAPLPRCRTTTFPAAAPASNFGSACAMYSYESPWKP